MQPDLVSAPPQANSRPRRRRWPKYVLGFLGLPLVLLACGYGFLYWSASRETASAVAETDRLDPRWRLADIDADREVLRDEDNSALQVSKVVAMAARNSRTWHNDFAVQFDKLEPPYQLNELQLEMLREAQEELQEALAEARKLKDMPKGRFALKWSADWISTNLNEQQKARRIFELLQHDAWLRAQAGDLDGAVESCRACLNAARSLGDEPILISFLIRVAGSHIALLTLERTLSQGRASDAALAPMQSLIEKEIQDVQKHWVNALRGERGGQQHLMQALDDGKFKLSQFGWGGGTPSVMDRVTDYAPVVLTQGYPSLLRHMNKVVEAAQLPFTQQYERMTELEKEIPQTSLLARLLAPAVQKVTIANLRDQTLLRSALIGVAAERFRMQKGRWPQSPEEIVKAGLVAEIPADPCDGANLRWRRFADGIVVYGVSLDRTDDGGNINVQRAHEKGVDVGIKLWDPMRRRQTARPPVVEGQ